MMLFEGESKYILTEKKLQISKIPSFIIDSYNKEEILLQTNIKPSESLLKISKINIDTLREFYDNEHVMITSGNEMYVELQKEGKIKKVHLHCYYNEQIGYLVSLLNDLIPKKYKIMYDK